MIDQPTDNGEWVTIEFLGTDAVGRGYDFSKSLAKSLASHEESKVAGVGLFLAGHLLDRAGARIIAGELGERGASLIVRLPVGGVSRK